MSAVIKQQQAVQAGDTLVSLRGLNRHYGDFAAVDNIDLDIRDGEFLTFLGSSGSGKSTTLSMLAGFETPSSGEILVGGQSLVNVPPHKRGIGMVFQRYSLFPHLSVRDNIAFPLDIRKLSRAERDRKVDAMLKLVQLEAFAHRRPAQLSGGQQQRVAIARALVYEPRILLMDEPLGALDKKLREHMQLEIKRIHREAGTTIVYVTHDQEEAMTMSDRICLMNGGRIEQLGSPADLYFRPRTPFVADFLGESNLFKGTVVSSQGGQARVALNGTSTELLASADQPLTTGAKVCVMVRPQNMAAAAAAQGASERFSGQLLDTMITGSLTKLYLKAPALSSEPVVLSFPTSIAKHDHALGSTVDFGWSSSDAVAVPEPA